MDLRKRIEEQEGTLQRLAAALPGFRGYRDRGLRRQADKLLRDHLVALLDGTLQRLQDVVSAWAEARKLAVLGDLDRLVGRVRKTRDGLRYADYGYTGWFDAVKIREEELDRLYEYDLSLRDLILEMDAATQVLAAATEEDLAAKMTALREATGKLQSAIDHRGEVVAGLIP